MFPGASEDRGTFASAFSGSQLPPHVCVLSVCVSVAGIISPSDGMGEEEEGQHWKSRDSLLHRQSCGKVGHGIGLVTRMGEGKTDYWVWIVLNHTKIKLNNNFP